MITKPARHRVQDLSSQMVELHSRNELKADVSAYLELLQMQLDAAEDENFHLSCSIGKSMRQIREKHDAGKWNGELHRQDTANDF